MSLLPIDSHTLIYGTADGGKRKIQFLIYFPGVTVHNDVPKFNALMKMAANRLNLKVRRETFVKFPRSIL